MLPEVNGRIRKAMALKEKADTNLPHLVLYDSLAAVKLPFLLNSNTIPFCIVFIIWLAPIAGMAQSTLKNFSQQITVTSENDRYMFQGKDGYYTNGLLLKYTKAISPKNSQKRLNSFELGQKMFLPYERKIFLPSEIDRPVTGYLYVRFLRTQFSAANQLWQWGASVDAIGDASLARSMQSLFHNWIGISSRWNWVWDYQLKSSIGVNLHGSFAKALLKQNSASFQAIPVTKATLGTSFTNISQGLVLQFGKLRPMSQSAFWKAALQSDGETPHTKPEWIFYYYPEVQYQAYNATVQGSLFLNDKGAIISSPEPFLLTHQAGVLFSADRYLLQLAANFQSKEAKSQRFSQRYGSIQVGYRIR